MAGRFPYSQLGGSSSNGPCVPPLPPPPPPPPPTAAVGIDAKAPQTLSHGYSYGYGYPLAPQTNRLAPGQAPPQAPIPVAEQTPDLPKSPEGEPSTPEIPDPKDRSWYCDACDLALDSQQAFKSHRRSHVKCSECSFEGAPKIVKAHYQGSHGKFSGSGFKTVTIAVPGCRVQRFRICVGNRPEDIQRWIAERKKRFPRQKSEEDDEAKTERADEANSAVMKEGPTGMNSLLAGYGSSGSESDDDELAKQTELPVESADALEKKIELESASSPKKDETISNDDIPVSNETPRSVQDKRGTRPCRYFFRNGSCLNGDSCRFSHEAPAQRIAGTDSGAKKRKRGGHTNSDTLLRKLLSSDMERESALTMKLLEYIVIEKDFFKNPSR